MKFIRLAYCDVGCPWCDTDYSPNYMKNEEEWRESFEKHNDKRIDELKNDIKDSENRVREDLQELRKAIEKK